MNKLRAIDLFCGAGGLTVGLQKAGFDVVAGVELWEPAVKTYLLNHPTHRLYDQDIKSLSPRAMMCELDLIKGELDLLAGCPPCQGFSTHRTRNKVTSVKDERNDLVFENLRFVREFLPKAIMMENVPGLAKDKRILDVLDELESLGYMVNDNTVQVKDAADYGVPQRRKRMILVASRFGFIGEPRKVTRKKTVRETIEYLKPVGESNDELHNIKTVRAEHINEMISLIPKNGGSRSDLPKKYWLPCHIRNPGCYRDVYGRMAWDDVAPTITGGCSQPSKGRYLHPSENRGISFREAALLQSFPKKYKFSFDDGKDSVALMIGNALPPEFIKRHALKILNHIRACS